MKLMRLFPWMMVGSLVSVPALAVEELIVTGSYAPVNAEQISSPVTVIDHEQLLQLSSHSLVEALRQVPSLWVEEQGGPGGITSISLRGAESNHTLVLLDGVQLNDPTNTRGGAFDVSNINIESIARIEIIRGAQSTVYGSDALAGVIHIITTDAGKKATQLNASVGEDGYKTAGISTSGRVDQVGYALTLQSKDAGEPVAGSTGKNTEVVGKLNWTDEQQALDANYRYFDGKRTSFPEQSGGPVYAVSRDLDRSEFTDQSAGLQWKYAVNDLWKSSLRTTWYNRTEDMTSPGVSPFMSVPPNGANTDFTRTLASWVNTLGDEQKFWSNLGVETKHESGDSKGYIDFGFKVPTDFALSRRINSGFINLNAYVVPDWLVQASLRHDDVEHQTSKNTRQLGTKYKFTDNLHWFANWGEGFKLPSFFALGHPLVGNPNLLPEESTTWDTGVEWVQDSLTACVSYFDNRYKNLIDFDATTFKNVNRSRVNSSGVESELTWQMNTQWQWRAHANYTDIDVLSSNTHLLGRPQVTAGVGTTYRVDDAWKVSANYQWVDSRYAVSLYTGNSVEQTLPNYNRVDVNVNWQATNQVSLGLSLENALDNHYDSDIGFPAVGTTAKLSVLVTL